MQYALRLFYVAIGVGLSAFVGKLRCLSLITGSLHRSKYRNLNFYLILRTSPTYIFAEGLCWARTAERQSSCMRLEYLKSVLKQEVGFFDIQAADSSNTYQVVTTISSDSNTIQVAIGEKVIIPY